MAGRVGASSEAIQLHQKILNLRQKATHVEQKDDFVGRHWPDLGQMRSLRQQNSLGDRETKRLPFGSKT